MLKGNKAFTLVEIIVGIMIVAIVIVSGFSAYTRVMIGKINLIEKSTIQKDSFFFTEKLFQLIKEGGTIDYEEYFNRRVVGNVVSNTLHFRSGTITNTAPGGHFIRQTGFGNFGRGGTIPALDYTNASPFPTTSSVFGNLYYYCISRINNKMPPNGCITDYNTNRPQIIGATRNINYTGNPQRYGQYSFQFIDYNSNASPNLGDENGNGIIIGDDNDEFLGLGPDAFAAGSDLKEIYLISGDKKIRTLIRWNVIPDEYAPTGLICQMSGGTITASSDGCRGTIEFLKLEGFDWGMDHIQGNNDSNGSENDGVIDTWIIDRQFTGGEIVVAGSRSTNYWQPLFPDSIHVTDFKVFMYPNIDQVNSWKNTEISKNISPYLIINFKIKPSWKTRIKLRNEGRELNFTTTINLTDIYSK